MKTKYKKIVVAIQTAFITSLVCSALPSYASDTELYKAPQTSVTTIMFMLDVSGSMNPSLNDYGENRIQSLKNGMLKLLQGDASQGIERLPDKLVVGLSEFSGTTGRIDLEARALGQETDIGTKEIYRVSTSATFNLSRDLTRVNSRERYSTQTRTRRYSWSDWGNWSGWSGWSNWTGWSSSNPSASGESVDSKVLGNTITVQECIDWNNINNSNDPSCKTWADSTKTLADLNGLNSTSQNQYANPNWSDQGGWINVGSTFQTNQENITCTDSSWGGTCYEQTNTRTNTESQNQKKRQIATIAGQVVTTYTGNAKDTHRNKMIRAVNALTAGGGTPTAFAYAEVAAYLMGQSTRNSSGSGFVSNVTNISGSTRYLNPETITSTKQCNTQGIYFLTDGVPEYGRNNSSLSIMRESLNDSGFRCTSDSLGGSTPYYNSSGNTNNWTCIGEYTKRLLKGGSNNPAGVSIKTAVVGFGSDMTGTPTSNKANDISDAKKWGILGGGGYYPGNNDADVVASVNAFLKKLQKYIPPVTTGSITIPVDNLDTQNIQPWGYFPQFDPAPDAQVTTWIGNLKKYQVVDNIIKDRDNKIVFDATKGISVDDPNDYWADTSIKKTITKIVQENNVDVEKEFEVRVGGALSQFKLGNVNNVERTIYTDRKVGNDGTASSIGNDKALLQVSSADLKANNPTNNFSIDTKRGYLAALFGYNVTSAMASNLTTSNSDAANTSFVNFLTQSNATLRQMGAVMHSRPILITQKGTTQFDAKTGDLSYKDRDDLIVFGTTQGLLHVIRAGDSATDSNAGKEVFTFVPNEMIEKQSKGFLNQENQGRNLEYGVDGPWTAYTEYVTKSGTNATEPVVTVSGGKQWLYGGLRMGGRSYYALDLSDVTSTSGKPKIKFRISPDDAAAYSPISYMGQSWSKPTLAWINWQGSRKLVMIVGGGYDPIYENIGTPTSSSIDKGAGVYIFDAETGSVLWWASANAAADKVTETNVSNMKRSVVSQIKAIDRNSDGLVDHLYFGDLGGQLWRVDLDSSNQAGKTANLAKRVTRILNQSNASDVPRFYSTPTFTIHNNGGSLFAVLTIGSGNLSSPMSETNKNDALYAIYDKDVTRRNLSVLKDSELNSVDINSMTTGSKQLVKNTDGNTATSFSFGGWYYPLGSKKRVLNDNIAIDSDLYVSIFNANIDIDDVDCYGGVRGESKANQFCLPYGQCTVLSGNTIVVKNRPNEISLGKGNIGISFGGKDKNRGLVLNFPTTETLTNYTSKTKFISQRWYER
ncbi:PilC/PilY family type IV pilus protein [Acinetobacter bereziniae]|uniref:PilC/PilY family type IV pilus protein n=1 Tax=Acinetobacter bereziniae TaxID=106648 RepID=UPI00374F7713